MQTIATMFNIAKKLEHGVSLPITSSQIAKQGEGSASPIQDEDFEI